MECTWIVSLVIIYTVTIFDHRVSGIERKISDGDYLEKVLEFPKVLKNLNEISSIPILKEGALNLYAPLKSISESCINDSKIYLQGLKDYDPWAIQMIDASSKVPSGFMAGLVQDFGNFDECLRVNSKAPISVQYCMVEFDGILPKPRKKYESVMIYDAASPLQRQNVPRLSFCLPSSCTVTDISEHFTQFVSQWNGTATTDKYSCITGENSPPGAIDIFALFFASTLFFLVSMSTVYELTVGRKYKSYDEPPLQHRLFTIFSLYKNGRQLLKIQDPGRSLSIVNGLRVLSIVWIMFGHYIAMRTLVPSVNYIYFIETVSNLHMAWALNAVLGVDTFLLLGGFLLSYLFLKEFSSGEKKFRFLPYFLHRYIRLTPLNYALVLLGITWGSKLIDEPLWNPIAQRNDEWCQANWWTNILYINNYVETQRPCIGVTWYLCVDLHLYLLSPLVLLPLIKHRRFAVIGLPIILLVSIAIPFTIAYIYHLPAASIYTRDNRSAWNIVYVYYPTHARAGPWIVGIILGYILHNLRDKKLNLSKLTATCGWITSLTACLATVYSISYFHQNDFVYDRLESALYIGLFRPVWATGVAWIIFACETGYGGPVRTFLSWRGFQPLGKLTFSIYLIHLFVQFAMVGITKSPTYVNFKLWTRDLLGEYFLTAFLGAIFSLAIEVPFMNIEKLMTKRVKKMDEKPTQDDDSKENSYTQNAMREKVQATPC